jgi:hypothetical protein
MMIIACSYQFEYAGIGKSMFMFYLTWRLRRIPAVRTVIKQRIGWKDFVDIANEQVIPTMAELPPDSRMDRWFLFDSNQPPIGLWPSVLVTSPKYDEVW